MSANFLQKLVNEDYETLLAFARKALENLIPTFKKVDPDNGGVIPFVLLVRTALGADGKLTALERKFVCEAFDLEEEVFQGILNAPGDEDMVDKFADALPVDFHADVVMFIATIAACDQTITRDEAAFITRVLA